MILSSIIRHDRHRIALQDDARCLRYGELEAELARYVAILEKERVTVLGLALDNSVEWLLWDLAALAAQITCVPLPPFFSQDQINHTIRRAAISHMVTPTGLQPLTGRSSHTTDGAAAASAHDRDTGAENAGKGKPCRCKCDGRCGAGRTVSFPSPQDKAGPDTARNRNNDQARPSPLPAGTAKVTFTSGTTGTPKGVCLPEQAMHDVATGIVDVLGEAFVGTHLSVMPLAVLLENVAGVYAGLCAGCTINLVSLERFGASYEHLHEILKQSKATSVILVPEILRALMVQTAKQGALPDLRMVAVGGARLDPQLITQARAMGLPVYEGYGLSECASVVTLNTPDHDQIGSVGKPLPHVQLQIIDGGIQIKHPGFLGYIGSPAAQNFDSGDLGHLDEDGFLRLSGRRKNVLITSYGRNISPEWVEAALLAQPQIAQAVVHGDGQAQLSALIVPSDQPGATHSDLATAIKRANSTLPSYAQIGDFRIIPPLAAAEGLLTGTGRPRRAEIFKRYLNQINHVEQN